MSLKRKKSEAWQYFVIDNDCAAFALCTICDAKGKGGQEELQTSWSVSPLWLHLMRHDPAENKPAIAQRYAPQRNAKQLCLP